MKNMLMACLFSTSLLIAGADSILKRSKDSRALQDMKRENTTVTPHDSYCKRMGRNTEIFCNNPPGFCERTFCGTPEAREQALVDYVMNKPLIINGQRMSESHDSKTQEMIKIFEENQRQSIKRYMENRSDNNAEEVCAAGCCIVISMTSMKIPCAISSALLALFSCMSGEQ